MREWLDKLKIAIIEEDGDKLISLSKHIPTTQDIDLAIEACALIEEAIKFAQNAKKNLRQEIEKLKKAKLYLR